MFHGVPPCGRRSVKALAGGVHWEHHTAQYFPSEKEKLPSQFCGRNQNFLMYVFRFSLCSLRIWRPHLASFDNEGETKPCCIAQVGHKPMILLFQLPRGRDYRYESPPPSDLTPHSR